ncbi:MAG: hyaluronan synthase [Mycobacterium sp.]|nr:hyaluronan synthase [Mycobacterium sp.]
MLIGILQLRHSLQDHARLYLFSIFVGLTWLLWAVKVILSRRYQPWTAPYFTTTSVVIPVVDEPVELFRQVLQRILEQRPTETIVVINGKRNTVLESVCDEFAPDVEWVWTPVAGKRNAVRIGTQQAMGEIVLLVDSDTIWTEGAHDELIKPFKDPKIGGVTTRQRILDPRRNMLTRWADWLENSRALYSMPAQSVLGAVGCLPGRTIALRRSVLIEVMDEFMTGRFLGVFLEVSDDRTLTNLTLKRGYRTVYQCTSLVYTDAPTRLKKLVKQQFRWARGSQYNTLRMLPWMLLHAPVLGFFFVCDIALPFLWLCSAIAWVIRTVQHRGDNLYVGLLDVKGHAVLAIVVLTILTSSLAMCLRQARHIAEVPADLFWMPLYIGFSTLVLMPIRLYGFLRLGHVGSWGTRADAYVAEQHTETSPAQPQAQSPAGASVGPARTATLNAPAAAKQPAVPTPTDGDPRALIPYAIAAAVIIAGAYYDVLPV